MFVTDKAVLALAHKIAVNTGVIREEDALEQIAKREPGLAMGLVSLAEDYVRVVRAADKEEA